MTSKQINNIITEFESVIKQIEQNNQTGRTPRSTNDPKQKFIELYNENEIETKNKLITQMNEIAPGTYKNFDEYIKYYNDNVKQNFEGFAGPKRVNGGKKSRRLRLKSNRKTKKKGRNSKK